MTGEHAHAGGDNAAEGREHRRCSDPEGGCPLAAQRRARVAGRGRGVPARRGGLAWGLLALATAGSLLVGSSAMPYDAAWGDTWSDGGGVLASRVLAFAQFYNCTVAGDDVMYRTQAACDTACKAGSCVLQSAEGALSAPEHVVLHPNSTDAREVVFTTLSPVVSVGDLVRMVIKTVDPSITLAVQEDPGLPIGMTSALNADNTELTVSWTPRVGQEGFVHELFVVGTKAGVKSKDLAVRIGVAAGALAWEKPTDRETQHPIVVGQTKHADLVCVANYPVSITVRTGAHACLLALARRTRRARRDLHVSCGVSPPRPLVPDPDGRMLMRTH